MTDDDLFRLAPPPQPLGSGKLYNVFLSYRSVNRPWVINLYDVLRSAGHKVFLDQTHLVAGASLHDGLQTALRASQAGVLVWSKAAADSKWVSSEHRAMMAIKNKDEGFNLVLIKLDGTDVPLFAEESIYLDFSGYPDGPNGGELLRLLHAVVGRPLSEEAARFAVDLDRATKQAEIEIDACVMNGDADGLLALATEGGLAWRMTPTLGARAGEALAKLDKADDAIDLLEKLSQSFPAAIRPRQMLAHALSRRGQEGDLARAQRVLGVLYQQGERDAETLGLYGRTFMDRYRATGEPLMLRRSRDLYLEGFRNATDDYYTGINAAAKSLMLRTDEDRALARDLALQVQAIVGGSVEPGMNYWAAATVAETQLLAGDFDAAGQLYGKAVALAPTECGSHRSSLSQARALLDAHGAAPEDREKVERAFAHLGASSPQKAAAP